VPTYASLIAFWRRIHPSAVEPLDVLFVIVSVFALRAQLAHGLDMMGPFDEGLLFTNAQLMADGFFPHRDFYSIYPPGIYQFVRAVLAFATEPVWTVRLAAFGVRLLSGVGAGYLVGRAQGRGAGLAAATAVLVLQSKIGLTAYAYTFAVLLALALIAYWPTKPATLTRTLCTSVLLALLCYLRHDLFVYVTGPLALIELATWVIRKQSLFFDDARRLLYFVSATVVALLLVWLPLFIRGGFSNTIHDLFLDLPRYVMAARTLPMPPLFELVGGGALNLQLPAFLAQRLPMCLVITASAVAAVGVSLWRALRPGRDLVCSRVPVLCSVFAMATLPQALQRTDYMHAAFGIPLMIPALACGLHPRVLQVVVLATIVPWFGEGVQFISNADLVRLWHAADRSFMSGERVAVADYVHARTSHGEPIFVGCSFHNRVLMSAMDIYYWTHRPNATRYVQFDPGLVTRSPGQRQMIGDLERTKPKLALLYTRCSWDEPNESMQPGDTLLDDYLARHYAPVQAVGTFYAWQRK
jgi:hypothetical protein